MLCAGARVVAIDPQPSCIQELRARFRGDRRVRIEPVGLGENEGTRNFYISARSGTSSFIETWEPRHHIGTLEVPIKTIENLITAHGVPRYIKIDVEGFELQVVTPLNTKVDLLSFEYHVMPQIPDDMAIKSKIIDLLGRFGILLFNLVPEGSDAFFWPEFVPAKTFYKVFPDQMVQATGSYMGDIFVKTT
jgi:FkbM family methyltransferase